MSKLCSKVCADKLSTDTTEHRLSRFSYFKHSFYTHISRTNYHTILATQIILIKRTVFRRLTDGIRTSKDGTIKDGNSIHTHFHTLITLIINRHISNQQFEHYCTHLKNKLSTYTLIQPKKNLIKKKISLTYIPTNEVLFTFQNLR